MKANSILKTASTEISTHYQLQLDELQTQYANLLREQYILAKNDNPFDALDQLSLNSSSLDSHIGACVDKLNRDSMSAPASSNLTNISAATAHQQIIGSFVRNQSIATLDSHNKYLTDTDDEATYQIQCEADVIHKVTSLRQQGMWEATRLPKVLEPPRPKCHWDFLLEEMTWLASDFEAERKWKMASLRKISRAVEKYYYEQTMAAKQARYQEELALRKRASTIAKQVQNFWAQVHKLVEVKEQIVDDHVNRYNMQNHLSDLIAQTENYSNQLKYIMQNDRDYMSSDSDKGRDSPIQANIHEEVNALQEEADIPICDFLQTLPEEYLRLFVPNAKTTSISSTGSRPSNGSTSSLFTPDKNKNFVAMKFHDQQLLLNRQENELGSKELNSVAEIAKNLQPSGNTLSTTQVTTPIPYLLKGGKLREYQHIGLDWLSMLHSKNLNGFLADEMGLGKTIQTIAFLCHLACHEGIWGPHLIIVPTSVILNWEYEFKKWCPAFKILTYYGNAKVRKNKRIGWMKPNAFHVCITSYQLAVADQTSMKGKINWYYIVLDEAQNIKNYKSQRWQTLLTFKSNHRLLLSGTPLQNNITELWALMRFLMPALFHSQSQFREWFSKPLMEIVEGNKIDQEQRDRVADRLHRVLRPFLLRRLKTEVELQLPIKIAHIVPCHLSKRQKFLYDDYMSLTETRAKISSGNAVSMLSILMQLRKVCNHPDLFELRPVRSPFAIPPIQLYIPAVIFLHSIAISNTQSAVFDKLLLIQNLGLSLLRNEALTTAFGLFRSLTLSVNENQFSITKFNTTLPAEPPYLFSRSKLDSFDLSLHSEYTLKQLHSAAEDTETIALTERLHYMYELNRSRILTPVFYGADLVYSVRAFRQSRFLNFRRTFGGYLEPTENTKLTDLFNISNPFQMDTQFLLKTFILYIPPVITKSPNLLSNTTRLLQFSYKFSHLFHELLNLKKTNLDTNLYSFNTNNILQFPETRLIQYDCGKLQVLDELLKQLKQENHRVLIFTQMSLMLNILESFLNYHGHTYLRLDGSTPTEDRYYLIERFNNDSRVFVFILSTRSGGLGMNLTGADTVIFYDIDWNPTMDAQAQDRCHRIGQTKNVNIYKLICEGTIEVSILKKSQQKTLLGELAIEKGHFTADFFTRDIEEGGLSDLTSKIGNQEQHKDISSLLFEVEDENDVECAKRATNEAKISAESDLLEQTDKGDGDSSALLPLTLRSEVEKEFISIQEELTPLEAYALFYLERNLPDISNRDISSNSFLSLFLQQSSEVRDQNFLGYSPAGFFLSSPSPLNDNIYSPPKDVEIINSYKSGRADTFFSREINQDATDTYQFNDVNMFEAIYFDDAIEMMDFELDDQITENDFEMLKPLRPSEDTLMHSEGALTSLYNTTDGNMISGDDDANNSTPLLFLDEIEHEIFHIKSSYLQNVINHERESIISNMFFKKSMIRRGKENFPAITNLFVSQDSEEDRQKIKKKLKNKNILDPLKKSSCSDQQTWNCFIEWKLVYSVLNYLEVPLSLSSMPPSMSINWHFVADYLTTLHGHTCLPEECEQQYFNILYKDKDTEADLQIQQKHKEKLKRAKARVELVKENAAKDNNSTIAKQFDKTFNIILSIAQRRKPTPSFKPNPLTYKDVNYQQSSQRGLSKDIDLPLKIIQNMQQSMNYKQYDSPSTPIRPPTNLFEPAHHSSHFIYPPHPNTLTPSTTTTPSFGFRNRLPSCYGPFAQQSPWDATTPTARPIQSPGSHMGPSPSFSIPSPITPLSGFSGNRGLRPPSSPIGAPPSYTNAVANLTKVEDAYNMSNSGNANYNNTSKSFHKPKRTKVSKSPLPTSLSSSYSSTQDIPTSQYTHPFCTAQLSKDNTLQELTPQEQSIVQDNNNNNNNNLHLNPHKIPPMFASAVQQHLTLPQSSSPLITNELNPHIANKHATKFDPLFPSQN